VRVQLGAGTIEGALLGSVALGLGVGLLVWTFGRLSGAQANPFISIVASLLGEQRWVSTARRVIAQLVGAALAALAVSALLPYSFARGETTVTPLADGVAAFGFVLVALGIAHRRDLHVPLGLGAFALASFWITGHGTIGNPLVAATVVIVGLGDHAAAFDVLRVVAATALGTEIAAVTGEFLFAHVRDAATALLFSPGRPSR
jgi:glycerol uptake facilitator-like aquaporin